MAHIRNSFIFGLLLLTLLSACGLNVPVTVVPAKPGVGQIDNNPGGPINLAATATTTPTAMPPTPVGPQIPNGVSTFAVNPGNAPGVLQIADCTPPVPSISKLTTFCANPSLKLGGANLVISNASIVSISDPKVSCPLSPSQNQDVLLSCSGTPNSSFQVVSCGSCGASTQPLSNFVCASEYFQDASGQCSVNSDKQGYYPCPSGSHYDNAKQACVDDSTSALNPQCPGGFDYYLPDQHACLQNKPTEIFNCQAFTVALGSCAQKVKVKTVPGVDNVCQPPAGGCGVGSNGAPTNWDQASCSCK